MEIGRFDRAIEDCDTYLQTYPDGAMRDQFRRWREEARLKAATAMPTP